MSDLDELQRWMTQLLRSRHALTRDDALNARIAEHIAGSERLSPAEQLEIYREQFWLRHTASLVEDFPGVGAIVGQHEWERLVEEFLASTTPSSWTLRDLGRGFPAHVERSTWLSHHELCADMARLEWAYIEVFDAAEGTKLDAERLAEIADAAWEQAIIVLTPALRLVRTRYPVASLRQVLRDRPDERVAIPAPDEQYLVIHRSTDRALHHAVVSAGAFALLDELGSGTALGRACERARERVPAEGESIATMVGSWFRRWGERGWVVDVLVE
jgi:hypothetical protein